MSGEDAPKGARVRRDASFLDSGAGRFLAANWALCFLGLMLVVFSLTGRGFLSINNFQNVVHLQTVPFLLAAAETFVIITGGIDLSVGFVMGLASVGAAKLIQVFLAGGVGVDAAIALAVVIVLAASLLPGVVSGVVITKFKVPPFIATLGMWGIANGLALKISQGYPMAGLPDELPAVGDGYLLYVLPGQLLSFFGKPAGFPDSRIRELVRLVPYSLPFIVAALRPWPSPSGAAASAATPTR